MKIEIVTPESVARQRVQAFFHFAKIDGSTHGHPVRLVTETRAERGKSGSPAEPSEKRVRWGEEEP